MVALEKKKAQVSMKDDTIWTQQALCSEGIRSLLEEYAGEARKIILEKSRRVPCTKGQKNLVKD